MVSLPGRYQICSASGANVCSYIAFVPKYSLYQAKTAYFNQNSNENFHRIVSVEVEGLFLIDQAPATYFSFMKFSLVSQP